MSNRLVVCRRFEFAPTNLPTQSSFFGIQKNCAPGRIRTADHLVRSQVLWLTPGKLIHIFQSLTNRRGRRHALTNKMINKTGAALPRCRMKRQHATCCDWLLVKIGAPGRIRTADHCVRSAVLYPAELRAQPRRSLPGPLRRCTRGRIACGKGPPCSLMSRAAAAGRSRSRL